MYRFVHLYDCTNSTESIKHCLTFITGVTRGCFCAVSHIKIGMMMKLVGLRRKAAAQSYSFSSFSALRVAILNSRWWFIRNEYRIKVATAINLSIWYNRITNTAHFRSIENVCRPSRNRTGMLTVKWWSLVRHHWWCRWNTIYRRRWLSCC